MNSYDTENQALSLPSVLRNTGKCILLLFAVTLAGFLFFHLGFTEANIITIYILGVLVISVVTSSWIYSLISSLVSVLVFNFFFTAPHFTFQAYDQGYPVTFLVMFLAAFITGSLASRLKNQARQSAQSEYRTRVLFETSQLLQQARGRQEIMAAAASQLVKLLERDVVFYLSDGEKLGEPQFFPADGRGTAPCSQSDNEKAVAAWVFQHNHQAGADTDTLSSASCLYLAIRTSQHIHGVAGIVMGEEPLDSFERSVLLSILAESALALENDRNAREKETAAILAEHEQLRANLLRSISHDLRTPLTSISGNATNLLSYGSGLNEETKTQIYTDIYDDSMWLINLVENLLSVTRIEDGQMNLNPSAQLMDEVIAEALRHINRKHTEHIITVQSQEEFLLARMDARLIIQVIINIVDNAIKYTPEGSEIRIQTKKEGEWVIVEIADNGPGIPDDAKPHVFDMFYCGANEIADSRRSLGLGLALCHSIIRAHGGDIFLSNQEPHGSIFTFTLPAEEVTLHE